MDPDRNIQRHPFAGEIELTELTLSLCISRLPRTPEPVCRLDHVLIHPVTPGEKHAQVLLGDHGILKRGLPNLFGGLHHVPRYFLSSVQNRSEVILSVYLPEFSCPSIITHRGYWILWHPEPLLV